MMFFSGMTNHFCDDPLLHQFIVCTAQLSPTFIMLGPDFKTREVRGEKQADEGTPVFQSSPVSGGFRGGRGGRAPPPQKFRPRFRKIIGRALGRRVDRARLGSSGRARPETIVQNKRLHGRAGVDCTQYSLVQYSLQSRVYVQ